MYRRKGAEVKPDSLKFRLIYAPLHAEYKDEARTKCEELFSRYTIDRYDERERAVYAVPMELVQRQISDLRLPATVLVIMCRAPYLRAVSMPNVVRRAACGRGC
jgi:hypothetical protein